MAGTKCKAKRICCRNRRKAYSINFQRWLRSVRGNLATFYMTYPYNEQRNDQAFTGVIVTAGIDFVVIQDEATGRSNILLYRNLDYVMIDLIY